MCLKTFGDLYKLSTGNWVANLLGISLSESVLDLIVESELCDGITAQLVNDIQVLEFLFSDRNENLTLSFVRLLHVLHSSTSPSKLPEVVDLIDSSYDVGLTRPIEEVIRDTIDAASSVYLGQVVSVLHHIDAYDLNKNTEEFELMDLLTLLQWCLRDHGNGTLWERIESTAQILVDHDDVWDGLNSIASLLMDSHSQISMPLSTLPPMNDPASLRPGFEALSNWLKCEECVVPALRVASSNEFTKRLFSTTTNPDGHNSPSAFIAELLANGTFQDLVNTIVAIFPDLQAPDSP